MALRLSYLVRSILGLRGDAETWPKAKAPSLKVHLNGRSVTIAGRYRVG